LNLFTVSAAFLHVDLLRRRVRRELPIDDNSFALVEEYCIDFASMLRELLLELSFCFKLSQSHRFLAVILHWFHNKSNPFYLIRWKPIAFDGLLLLQNPVDQLWHMLSLEVFVVMLGVLEDFSCDILRKIFQLQPISRKLFIETPIKVFNHLSWCRRSRDLRSSFRFSVILGDAPDMAQFKRTTGLFT